MSARPRVSLVIPSWTGATDRLEAQLARQTLRADQHVVVRGASPPAKARNQGATEAFGDILIFLDDDVTLAQEDLLERLVESLERAGAHSVVGVRWRLPAEATPFQRRQVQESFKPPSAPVQDGMTETAWHSLGASCFAIRREVFLLLGGFDARLPSGEDHELWYRLTRRGGRICVLADRWIYHLPPRRLADLIRKTLWYERGNAQVTRRHPESGYRLVLRGRGHAAGYLALRTLALLPLMFIKLSYRHRRPTFSFRPQATLLSYLGAWAYCASWFSPAEAASK